MITSQGEQNRERREPKKRGEDKTNQAQRGDADAGAGAKPGSESSAFVVEIAGQRAAGGDEQHQNKRDDHTFSDGKRLLT